MRRVATVAALGLLAAAVPLLLGPGAGAEQQDKAPSPSRDVNTVEIAEIESADVDMSYLAGRRKVLSYPGARFVKLHFSRLELAPNDYITISDPYGGQETRYTGQPGALWTTSVTGDSAVVRLHSEEGPLSDAMTKFGAEIDKVSKGLSPDEVRKRERAERRPESVCGDDDQRDAVCYESTEPEVYANAAPVARLLIDGSTMCTAWRVGSKNRLLTNNHCFETSEQARDTEVWFNYACSGCGGQALKKAVKVRGESVIETNAEYDYTLFTVDDFDAIRRFGQLELADRAPREGEKLYIPQHPGGEPAKVALESDADSGACVVDKPSFDGYVDGSDVSYYCDTEFGSSGSPVLSRETHEVIGLHHFGGCPNSGVRSDKIHDRVKGDI
ncbi:trypsin-like serine peptidase [Stackebrandtia nassauensis]|uniref:Serine protease n=1 Tax=Stackebrandtia nassauensis (strain DSM 44728 / CIP 108903 / NRRL B-16338 / NBRC 102104 / LLR-40K-21) TaxID=446470 RepID=D3PTY7_STANL|nr:serine protease [Stackebrandtia nassauensis]ADD39745.1 PKD repeat-containing protein [Stackebrandtia nassauensis DSM 44728]